MNDSFTTCSDLLSGRWKSRQILDEHQGQHTTYQAVSVVLLVLRATWLWSVGGNPSRACLVLPGALSIFLARYFTTPSRQDIDRAPTLTAASRILDGAGAGQAAPNARKALNCVAFSAPAADGAG